MLKALDILDKAFPSKEPGLRNRAVVLGLMRLASKIVDSSAKSDVAETIGAFYRRFDQELRSNSEASPEVADFQLGQFQKTISGNLTSGAVIKQRENILLKRYIRFSPEMASEFQSEVISDADVSADVETYSESIFELVTRFNAQHSTDTGKDGIKLTTKVVKSLKDIGNPVDSLNSYGELIDSLYFLFYEGTAEGARFGSEIPAFVQDIRLLRTGIRHDVDHGKQTNIKKKKIAIGDTFSKFSGGPRSPETLSPESFRYVQANILSSIVGSLGGFIEKSDSDALDIGDE